MKTLEIRADDDVTVHPEDRWIVDLVKQERERREDDFRRLTRMVGFNPFVELRSADDPPPTVQDFIDLANELRLSSAPPDHLATPPRRYFADPHTLVLAARVALP